MDLEEKRVELLPCLLVRERSEMLPLSRDHSEEMRTPFRDSSNVGSWEETWISLVGVEERDWVATARIRVRILASSIK